MSFFRKFLVPMLNSEEEMNPTKEKSVKTFAPILPILETEPQIQESQDQEIEIQVKETKLPEADIQAEEVQTAKAEVLVTEVQTPEAELLEKEAYAEEKSENHSSILEEFEQRETAESSQNKDNFQAGQMAEESIQEKDDEPAPGASEISEEVKPLTISAYFRSKNIHFEIPDESLNIAPVESIAFAIAKTYPQTKAFIRFIRESITKRNFEFIYYLSSHSAAEKNAIISIAEKLNEYGILSSFYSNKANNALKGAISTAPRCINFINGDFLEIYTRVVTMDVIKTFAEKYNCEYEFYHNVLIKKGAENHELDLVFRLGDQIFWSEVKSGKFNPDDYRKLGLLMEFVPDKFILLAADKSNEASEAISYFYEYYVANINAFKSTLIKMMEKAMEGALC